MLRIEIVQDPEEVKRLWQRFWPQKSLFDLWPVRSCFQAHFKREPHVLVASRKARFQGMLALSWIREEGYFGHFPGEVWQGKTWLEQNRIVVAGPDAFKELMDCCPCPTAVRYLEAGSYLQGPTNPEIEPDETGYLFYPGQYGYSFQEYLRCFSSKSRRKMRHEMDLLSARGLTFRYDHLADLDTMFRLNMDGYGAYSYFSDPRFLGSFERLAAWLHANGLLRVTTVLIGDRVAAVDMGAVWEKSYTVLAGGTSRDFPGVAKIINFHHMEWACAERISVVDFLCGEFNWKDRFHLTPRPLYRIRREAPVPEYGRGAREHRVSCEY